MASTFAALVKGGKRGALEQVAERVQAPWVEIEAEAPLTLNLDGEPVQARHFRIDCVPGRVNLHVALDSPLLSRA